MNRHFVIATLSAVLVALGCAESTGPVGQAHPRVTMALEGSSLAVEVGATTGAGVTVLNASYVSPGPTRPGVGLVVRDGARVVPPCARVNYTRPKVDPEARLVSNEKVVRTSFPIADIQRTHCLKPGRYQVQASLVQPGGTYWSNPVSIEVGPLTLLDDGLVYVGDGPASEAAPRIQDVRGKPYLIVRSLLIAQGWAPVPAKCSEVLVCGEHVELAYDVADGALCGTFEKASRKLTLCGRPIADGAIVEYAIERPAARERAR